MKRHIMAIGDGPFSGTGFSEELRHVLFRLAQHKDKFDIHWQSLQHYGFPITISDTMFSDIPNRGGKIKLYGGTLGDLYQYGADIFPKNYREINPELVWFMGDPRNIKHYIPYKKQLGYPWLFYCTLDGTPIHPNWKEYLQFVNALVMMTEWAQDELIKAGFHPGFIWHGLNWKWWGVKEEEKLHIRRQYNIDDDVCVFINWDVPQHRKRTDALLRCWKDFIKRGKGKRKAILILYSDWHMAGSLGWNIDGLIEQYNIPKDNIIGPIQLQGSPKYWHMAETIDQLKKIVSMGDILTCTNSGEGFGKTKLEGLGMGIPVIVTDYAANSEVCQKGSILVPCYEGRAGRFRMDDRRRSVEAGVVNEEKFVDAMEYLYEDENERRRLGREARRWSKNFDYDTAIVPQWVDLLENLDTDLIAAKELLNL